MTQAAPERTLVTITGHDQPDLVARIMQPLAASGAVLADVELSAVQGHVTISLLLEPADPQVLERLRSEAVSRSLTVRIEAAAAIPAAPTHDDWIITLIAETLGPAALHAVARCLAECGAAITLVRTLTHDPLSALELRVGLPAGDATALAVKRALLDLSLTQQFDIAIQRDDVFRRSKRLVVMDMDSTLIQIEVIDELAKAAGAGEKVAAITRAAMAGELDYDESLRRRVALLAGLDASHLERIATNLPLSRGVETLIVTLKKLGLRTAVVSGGFDVPARALQQRLGLDEAHSNVLEVRDGKLTGRVEGRIVNARAKAELLEQIARREGIALEQTVAIGDGANDLLMIQKAGLGIAFHGKPKLREAADGSLTGGLDTVLYLLGLGTRELHELAKDR